MLPTSLPIPRTSGIRKRKLRFLGQLLSLSLMQQHTRLSHSRSSTSLSTTLADALRLWLSGSLVLSTLFSTHGLGLWLTERERQRDGRPGEVEKRSGSDNRDVSSIAQIGGLRSQLHSLAFLLGVEGINSNGIDKLIQVAAPQLSDRLPESREAAGTLLLKLQTIYEKSHELTLPMSDNRELSSWEHFCQSKLSPLGAQAMLRVTNIAREGVVLGS